MPAFYVTAEIQPDQSIEMKPAEPIARTGPLTHRVVKQLSAHVWIVVWWPERLDPALEDRYSQAYADQVARNLGLPTGEADAGPNR